MTNEISPMQSVQEKIKARIQADFVNLIPDEMWDQLVSSTLSEFRSPKDARGYDQVPPIKKMIDEAIRDQAKTAIQDALSRVHVGTWDNVGNRVVGEAMKKLIKEHFDEVLKSVQAGMVEFAVMAATNHMRNAIQNGMRF